MRIALKISYDGTMFEGWQVQPGKRTVQGELERAACELFGAPVKVAGSGRTDSGVHAEGQVCHLDADTSIPARKIRECLNERLPEDVRVLRSAEAPEGFDCTRNAKRKTYRYRFYHAETEQPLLERYAVRVREKPDLGKMQSAARLYVGEHDFAAFRASGGSAKTTVRTIYRAEISEIRQSGATVYEFVVCGNGFLYNMVRILAGHLVDVGCGKKEEESILAAYQTGDRSLLGKTMAAKGLTMVSAEYEPSLFPSEGDCE